MCLRYKEAKAMENKLLEKLYDIFYTPPDFLLQQQEMEEGRRALDKVLDKQMYRMVIQITGTYANTYTHASPRASVRRAAASTSWRYGVCPGLRLAGEPR